MTPERLEGAEAPWITWTARHRPAEGGPTLREQGELDGKVGVFAAGGTGR